MQEGRLATFRDRGSPTQEGGGCWESGLDEGNPPVCLAMASKGRKFPSKTAGLTQLSRQLGFDFTSSGGV